MTMGISMILLIDDGIASMQPYRDALAIRGHDVRQVEDPAEALEYLDDEERRTDVQIILLDIMMPPCDYSVSETRNGVKTGTFLFHDIRARCPDTPVIVLTNVVDEDILAALDGRPNCQIANKMDTLPFALADAIDSVLAG